MKLIIPANECLWSISNNNLSLLDFSGHKTCSLCLAKRTTTLQKDLVIGKDFMKEKQNKYCIFKDKPCVQKYKSGDF